MNIIELSTSQDLATLISNINKNFSTIASYSPTQAVQAPQPIIRTMSLSELGVKEFLQKTWPNQKNIGSYSAYDISGMQIACCYDENNRLVSSFPFSFIDKRFHNTDLLQSIQASSLVGQTDMTCTLIYQDDQWNSVQNIPCIYSDGSDLYYRLNGTDTSLRINAPEVVASNKIPGTCICVASSDTLIGEVSGKSIEDTDLSLIDRSLAFVLYSPGVYYISMLSRSGSELRWSKNENLRIDTNKGLSEVLASTGWVWQAYVSAQGIAAHSLFSKNNNLYLSLQKTYDGTETGTGGKYLNVFNLIGVNTSSEYSFDHSAEETECTLSKGVPVLPGEQWYLETEENSTSNIVSEIGLVAPDAPTYKTRSQSTNGKTIAWTLLTIPPDVYELKILCIKFPKGTGSHKIKFTKLFKKGAGLNIDEPTTIQNMLTSDSQILIGPFQHLNTEETEVLETSNGQGAIIANKINADVVQVNRVVSHTGGQNLQLSNGNELQYIGFRYTFPWGKSTRWVWAQLQSDYKLEYQIYAERNLKNSTDKRFRDFCFAACSGGRYMRLPLLNGSTDDNDTQELIQISGVDPTFSGEDGATGWFFIVGNEINQEIDVSNNIKITQITEQNNKITTQDITYNIYFNIYKRYSTKLTYLRSSYQIDTDGFTVLRIQTNAPIGTRIPINGLAASLPTMIKSFGDKISDDMDVITETDNIDVTSGYGYISNVGDMLFNIGYYTISIRQDGIELWSEYYDASEKDENKYVYDFAKSGIYKERLYRDNSDPSRLTFLENISKLYKGTPSGVDSAMVLGGFAGSLEVDSIMKSITKWYITNGIYISSNAYLNMLAGSTDNLVLATITITQNIYTINTGQLSSVVAGKSEIIAKKS